MTKLNLKRFAFLGSLLFYSCVLAWGQMDPGIPAFESFGGGPFDVVNLGNLNVHLVVPTIGKPGRGINFSYAMNYDSSVLSPVLVNGVSTWQPVNDWGWTGKTQAATGFVSYKQTTLSCRDPYSGQRYYYALYNYQAYVDRSGNSHPVNASVAADNPCTGASSPPVTVLTTDGSGNSVTVDGSPSATVNPANGGTVSPPLQSDASSGNAMDNNGNLISGTSAGIFTDTLGTTALTITGAAPNPVSFTYSNPPGVTPATSSVVMNYTNQNVRTNFGCSGIVEYAPTTVALVSSIVLADNSTYSFTYEPTPGYSGYVTGRIASVTLPTGGTISYQYTGANNGIICADGSAAGLNRTTSDSATPWTYARSGASPNWITTITDPQLNQSVINFHAAGAGIYETKRQTYQGSSTGTPLQTVYTCYTGTNPDCSSATFSLPIARRTVYVQLDNGQQATTDTFYNNYGLATQINEYDFVNFLGFGTLRRQTLFTYAALGNGIFDRIATVTVKDGSGVQIAQMTNGYDEYTPTVTNGVPQHVSITGSRGNLTSVRRWLNTGQTLPMTLTYNDAGNLLTVTDPGNHTISGDYGNSNAYLTRVTYPFTSSPNSAQHFLNSTYDSNTGLLADSADQNNNHTTYSYDKRWRPLTINYPDGGQTSFAYPNSGEVDVSRKIDASRSQLSLTQVDVIGTPFSNTQ